MKPKQIPEGHSPVRFIMSEKYEYHPLKTFEAAKADPDGVAVFEGDYGGQIMMTIRMKHVKCSEDRLNQLLEDLNDIYWDGYEGAGLYYERIPVGGGVVGGMGGGAVVDGVWAHHRFEKKIDLQELGAAVGEILECRSERLPEKLRPKKTP